MEGTSLKSGDGDRNPAATRWLRGRTISPSAPAAQSGIVLQFNDDTKGKSAVGFTKQIPAKKIATKK